MPLSITVAICTRNRARQLEQALHALVDPVRGCSGQAEVEVLVVDNGSSDDTAQVTSSMAASLPLRHVYEPAAGLSHARNRACEEARGDYIAWIDDDVIVGSAWLRAYTGAIHRHPDAAFFGGPIVPKFEGVPPSWLRRSAGEIEHIYSARDLGTGERCVELRRDLPFGANYVVRRRDQLAVSYDPRLGRQPSAPWLAGEESVLLGALLDAGGRGWWVPAATVGHVIPGERQTLRYLLAHGYGMGRTYARRRPVGGRPPLLLGRPRWLWSNLYRQSVAAASAWLFQPPAAWVPAVYAAATAAGRLRDQGVVDGPLITDSQRVDSRSQE